MQKTEAPEASWGFRAAIFRRNQGHRVFCPHIFLVVSYQSQHSCQNGCFKVRLTTLVLPVLTPAWHFQGGQVLEQLLLSWIFKILKNRVCLPFSYQACFLSFNFPMQPLARNFAYALPVFRIIVHLGLAWVLIG